jgi:hypothetical protein
MMADRPYWLNPKGVLHPDHIREMERIGTVEGLDSLGGRGGAAEAELEQLGEASQEGAMREGQPTAPIDSTVRAKVAEDPDRQHHVRSVGRILMDSDETVLLLEAVGPLRKQYALAATGAEGNCVSLGLVQLIDSTQPGLVQDKFVSAPQMVKIGMGDELTQLRLGFIDLNVTFVESTRPQPIEFLVIDTQWTGNKENPAIFLNHSAIKEYEAAARAHHGSHQEQQQSQQQQAQTFHAAPQQQMFHAPAPQQEPQQPQSQQQEPQQPQSAVKKVWRARRPPSGPAGGMVR